MDQKICLKGFFQRCLEAIDQVGRQIGNETDGVNQRRLAERGKLKLADSRIEGRERHVLGKDIRAGQAVEQRGLAGVGIAYQRDNGRARPPAPGTLHGARTPDFVEIALEADDLVIEHPAVSLKLAFAGT